MNNQHEPAILVNGIPTKSAICPACGEVAEWYRDIDEPGLFNDLTSTEVISEGWHCADCDWSQETVDKDYIHTIAVPEQYHARINAINLAIDIYDRSVANREYPKIKVEDLFEHAPDGDFEWIGEVGDWYCYHCGDKDCPVGWHVIGYYETIGRRDGKRYVELWDCDGDGNHDINGGWIEDEDWETSDCISWLGTQSGDYFRDWAKYYLDCFYSRVDPLDQILGSITEWHEFCLAAAEDNIKYLQR